MINALMCSDAIHDFDRGKTYKTDPNQKPFDDSKIISKAEEKRERKALNRLQNG